MSEIIEVCGKMVKIGNVYKAYRRDENRGWVYVRIEKDHCYSLRGQKLGPHESIFSIEGINGEVLEDAPFKPEVGQWFLFSDEEDFKNYSISKLKNVNDTAIGLVFIDGSIQGWHHCKPVSPELAALLDKELD